MSHLPTMPFKCDKQFNSGDKLRLSNWGTRCRPHCKCTPLPSWQQGIQPMRPQLEPLPRRRGVDRRACRASDEGDASRRHPNRESLPNIFVGCTLPDGAYGTTGCRWQNGPLEKAAAAMDWGIVARGPTNQFDRVSTARTRQPIGGPTDRQKATARASYGTARPSVVE